MMKSRVFIVLMIFGLVAAFSGCSGSKIYLMDLRYISEKKPPPASALQKAKVVGICPFEDARKDKNKESIGIRHRHDKSVDILKVEGASLSESVTKAVKDYFVEQGFKITDCKGWDKSPEGLAQLPEDLLLVVGGNIESFNVEARSSLTTTEILYKVKLVAAIGQMEKRQVITRKIERAPQTKRVGFDPDKVKAKLNSALTNVIQDLFEDSY
jgi:hypothetical protein